MARGNAFTGKVNWVQIDVDAAAEGHRSPDRAEEAVPTDDDCGNRQPVIDAD